MTTISVAIFSFAIGLWCGIRLGAIASIKIIEDEFPDLVAGNYQRKKG